MVGRSANVRDRKPGAAVEPLVGPANTAFAATLDVPVPPCATGNGEDKCVLLTWLLLDGPFASPLNRRLPAAESAGVVAAPEPPQPAAIASIRAQSASRAYWLRRQDNPPKAAKSASASSLFNVLLVSLGHRHPSLDLVMTLLRFVVA